MRVPIQKSATTVATHVARFDPCTTHQRPHDAVDEVGEGMARRATIVEAQLLCDVIAMQLVVCHAEPKTPPPHDADKQVGWPTLSPLQ